MENRYNIHNIQQNILEKQKMTQHFPYMLQTYRHREEKSSATANIRYMQGVL